MSVFGLSPKKANKVAVIQPPLEATLPAVDPLSYKNQDGLNVTRFRLFWDLMDTIQVHGYLRAAMSVVGRATIGAWWNLVRNDDYGSSGTERQRKRLMQFYTSLNRDWDNIKDFQGLPYKLMIGAMYLRLFGSCAYQIVRNSEGIAIGLDFLHGYIFPNVDENGYFQKPAFYQYISRSTSLRTPFEKPTDLVFITNPDWRGYPGGGSDIEALTDFALPLDLYLQIAAREYMKNRDKPEAFYILPSDASEEAFNAFVEALDAKYSGAGNVGRNPIAVQGELEIKELSKLPADLPYQEARQDTRQEALAVSGVAGAKLGLTDSLTSANLREARREFHETTMVPLFKLLETAFYEQIHVREFGITGWEFKFNSPDFLNAVERATVHMRYQAMSVLNANEIRKDIGRQERKDPLGDKYQDEIAAEKEKQKADAAQAQAEAQAEQQQNPQGSPPEGREQRPDAPSKTGEPTLDNQDPPRGDQHDQTIRILDELRRWRSFALKRVKRNIQPRLFDTQHIPSYMRDAIQDGLLEKQSPEEVRAYFNDVERVLRDELEIIEK